MLHVLPLKRDMGLPQALSSFAQRAAGPAAMTGIMFLLMHFELMLRASPLAAALMAAGLSAGRSPGALAAGCLLGMLRLPPGNIPLLPAVNCALVLAIELILSLLPSVKKWNAETRVSLVSGFCVLIPGMIAAGGSLPESVRVLGCAALAAAAAPFFMPALALQPERTRLVLQEKIGVVLIVCGCIAGLHSLCAPLAEFSSILLLLLVPGAAAGSTLGVALLFGGGGMARAASLAIASLAGGLKICILRWQRSLMVCMAAAAMHAYAPSDALDVRWALCAAAVYLLLPEKFVLRVQNIITPAQEAACDSRRISHEITAETRHRLRALGDAFSEMAESSAAPTGVPDEQELICEMRSRLCTGCAGYEACWAGDSSHAVRLLCSLIGDALERVDAPPGMRVLFSDGDIPPGILRICRRGRMIPDRLGLLLRDFAEKRRSEIKRCATGQIMAVQFTQAREILYGIAEKLDGHSLSEARLEQMQSALAQAGLANCTVSGFGPEPAQLRVVHPEKWQKEDARRAHMALQHATGYRLLPRLQGDAMVFMCAPRLAADTGSSCRSGIAGETCGDSHMVRMLDASRLLLALSDGMGSGEAAACESAQALRLLWRFLEAGISRPLALETVNRQLLTGSCEDMFATIDLCIIDLNTGIAEITKLAACRTLILRGKELVRIEGGNLPLGILESVQPNVHRFRLRPGDVLIMGSDGVMEAGDALLIERIVRENAACPPEQLAETLVREAGLRRNAGRSDDLTCICVRMEDARKAG